MYNFIRKDVVSAIKWFNENNKLYGDVKLNETWDDEWINSEFSCFLDQHTSNDDEHSFVAESGSNNTNDVFDGSIQFEDDAGENGVTSEHNSMNNNVNSDTGESSLDQKELTEDQAASHATINVIGQPMPNVLQP